MPTFELQYFSPRGRPEPIRLALHYAGVAFTDTYVGDWMARKPGTPLGQLPVFIETNGNDVWEIPQSGAQLRHIARTFDLYGKTEREHTQVDIAIDTANDASAALTPFLFGPQRGKDPAALRKHFDTVVPQHFARFVKLLGAGTWVAGTSPTVGDFCMFHVIENHLFIAPDLLGAFPTLAAFVDRVRALPTLQAYLGGRKGSEIAQLAPVLATGNPL